MEESLNKQNFDPIAWLNANLDINRSESLETQLTELTFNLQNYQNELESVIIASKEAIEKFMGTVENDLEIINDEYDYINQFIKMNFGELELEKLKTNDSLFTEINEKNMYKTRINNTITTIEQVISLDFYMEEIKNLLEAGDIYTLEKKIIHIQKPISIILKLPLIHPLHEKVEALMKILDEKLNKILAKKVSKDDTKLESSVLSIYKIYKILNLEKSFLQIYEQQRLIPKIKSFTTEISALTDIRDVNPIIAKYFQSETEYMTNLAQTKSNTFIVDALKLFATKILPVYNENIFLSQYLNSNSETTMELFGEYIQLVRKVQEICGTLISDQEELNQILIILYQPITSNRKKVIENEIRYLEKELNHIVTDFDFRESFSDKLSAFDFLGQLDTLYLSFERIFDTTLGIETEEWTNEVQNQIENYLNQFINIVQEIDTKLLKSPFLEKFLMTQQTKVGSKLKDKGAVQPEKLDFSLSQFLSMLDVLIKKHEDFIIFEEKIAKFDFKIRTCLLENNFSSQESRYLLINMQKYVLSTEENINEDRKNFFMAIQNGLILFDGLLKSIRNAQEYSKKIILKILIMESYNKLVEMPKDKIWSLAPKTEGEQPKNQMFNPSEFVLPLSQNFFAHLQILEEIMNNRAKKAQDNDINIQDLYTKKLESEYQTDNLSFEKKNELEEKINLVKYWAFQFSNTLLKVYRALIETIELATHQGLYQLKSDIEYLTGVLQTFRFMGKITEFDILLKIIETSKPTDKINLKEVL